MANTYSQIYIQVVFTVKRREKLIPKTKKEELFRFITGIIKNNGQLLLQINGVQDHIHILLRITPSIHLSDLVRDIKTNSSRFINENGWCKKRFAWQEGYGAFSYSHSEVERVQKYILKQEEYHAPKDFKKEYLDWLDNFEVDYNLDYAFD
jgi:putative transposase